MADNTIIYPKNLQDIVRCVTSHPNEVDVDFNFAKTD